MAEKGRHTLIIRCDLMVLFNWCWAVQRKLMSKTYIAFPWPLPAPAASAEKTSHWSTRARPVRQSRLLPLQVRRRPDCVRRAVADPVTSPCDIPMTSAWCVFFCCVYFYRSHSLVRGTVSIRSFWCSLGWLIVYVSSALFVCLRWTSWRCIRW